MAILQLKFKILSKLPFIVISIPMLLLMRILRPLVLIRIGNLVSQRIGHLAGNTDLYLCEQLAGINVPKCRYRDIFFMGSPISNSQLAKMWRRRLIVWPSCILSNLLRLNNLVPGGKVHQVGQNTQWDRDVNNLLDKFPMQLAFTQAEEEKGESTLRSMGIPENGKYVCLIVRDSAYLSQLEPTIDWSYHSYRDSSINDCTLAVQDLVSRGYFVLRMGVIVSEPINFKSTKVIDYANSTYRSEFMDIYLGAKCTFCISTGTGFDSIASIFRRPIVFINLLPFGQISTFCKNYITITKRYYSDALKRDLSISEIYSNDVGFLTQTDQYDLNGIKLIDNTPAEIRDAVVEMAERLDGSWRSQKDDEDLQNKFWEMYRPFQSKLRWGKPLHGEIRSRFGASFLRNNQKFIS